MAEALHRVAPPEIEIRSGGDGRTVFGILCPFGEDADIYEAGRQYTERFVMGAFARTIRERGSRIKLFGNHDTRKFPLGPWQLLREDPAGLYGEARISKTAAGDEVLELVRDGALDSWSVSFVPCTDRIAKDGALERTEVKLIETSIVSIPAYSGALVGGVRTASAAAYMTPEAARLRILEITQ